MQCSQAVLGGFHWEQNERKYSKDGVGSQAFITHLAKVVCVCVCMEGFKMVNVCGIVGEITNIKITKIGWNFIVS